MKFFLADSPNAKQWIKKMVGAQEFINNKERYCLWLVGCTPSELKSMPRIYERVQLCRDARLNANVESCVDDPNKARNNFGSTFLKSNPNLTPQKLKILS